DCVKDITSGNRKFKTSEYLESGIFPIIDQGNNLIGGYTNFTGVVNRKKDVVIFGDHTKLIKYIDFDFCLGADGVKVLEPKTSALNTKYLYYYLKTIQLHNAGYSRHYKFLKETNIPLPPLETQKKIADILDTADQLRSKTQELIKKYDELAQAIFIDMFGDPITNPKEWEIKKLSEVTLKITDGTHQSPKFKPQGIPFLFVSNIVNNTIQYETNSFISQEDFEIYSKRTPIEIGNILLTTVGSYGNPAIINSLRSFAFQRHIAFIKPNHNLINFKYLFAILKSDLVKTQIERDVRGVAQKTLNLSDLKDILIWVPEISFQNKYASILEKIDEQKMKMLEVANLSEQLFQSLLQRAFNGKLVR